METNAKDGSAATPPRRPVLNVQPLRTVSPLLRAQQPYSATAPHLASTQQPLISAPSAYPVFDPVEIRKRIQENVLLRTTQQSKAFAVSAAGNPNAETHIQGTTDKIPSKNNILEPIDNGENRMNALKELCSVPTAMKTSPPSFLDSRGYVVCNRNQTVCDGNPGVKRHHTEMNINAQMFYDHRGRVNIDKFKVSGDQNPPTATFKNDCPLHNSPHMQQVLKSNVSVPPVYEKNPMFNEHLQAGISQSAACPLHTSLFWQKPTDLNTNAMSHYQNNTVAGGNINQINTVARGNIKPVNLNRIAIPDIQDHIGSEKKTKSANLYPFAMPDKQENTRPGGKTDPANLYPHAMPYNQENTESERQTQGEGQNIQIAADSCRQAPMEANTPFIATPAKLNNLLPLPIVPKAENQLALPIIPKAEYVSEYTPKLRIECGTRPVHSASLNSDNLSLVPKREIGNSGIMAFLEAQVQGGSASASIVSHMNTQVVPNAEELRSALAKSLKRYKDLTVLHPGSTAVERRGSLTMAVDNTDTEAGSKKRKRARPTRPRPVIHNPYPSVSGNDREIVMRALVTYDALRRHLRDETRRPDLQAGVLMIDKGLAVNRDRRIVGAIPGVNVGDHFYFRMELCVISLHCPTQAGIDYITAKNSEWHEPIATSIIASGGYEDNEDGGEELIYTGHGGNNYVMDKKQSVDQKLERGNFALERSKHYQIEIRVIRGIKDSGSPSGKIYIYDGLYKVVDSWLDRGRSGSGVFKYKLHRTPGQPELGSAILKNTRRWKSEPTLRVGLVHPDISLRSENLPVCLVNDVDNEKGPPHFEYATTVRYPDSLVSISQGCECVGGCCTGGSCSCIQKNGGQMPYNANGILIKGKPLVYECGIHCKCPPSCWNRSTQKGLNVSLEIFRTRGTNANANGWGVRSLDPIAAGSFICEYTGEVVPTEGADADQQSIMDSEYVLNPRRQVSECGDVYHILAEQLQDASSMLACPPTPANLDFLIDASKIGNVSRFINHGSFPNANVFMQFVLHDHLDCRFPHVMLFALYNIPPLTELLLDYKEETVLIQPKEEKNFIQQKEEVEAGSAFECSHSVVKIEPYYT